MTMIHDISQFLQSQMMNQNYLIWPIFWCVLSGLASFRRRKGFNTYTLILFVWQPKSWMKYKYIKKDMSTKIKMYYIKVTN